MFYCGKNNPTPRIHNHRLCNVRLIFIIVKLNYGIDYNKIYIGNCSIPYMKKRGSICYSNCYNNLTNIFKESFIYSLLNLEFNEDGKEI